MTNSGAVQVERTYEAGRGLTYPEQRAIDLEPMWQVNDEQGAGLLALPFVFTPAQYAKATAEIEAKGYEVVEHDSFHVHMAGITYYQLRQR